MIAAAAAASMVALPSLAVSGDIEDVGPLPWRVGGRVGFTVDAATFPDSATRTLEVYVRVPPVTMAALARDTLGAGRLRLTARLRSSFGGSQETRTQEFDHVPADSATGFGKVVLLRFSTKPGPVRLRVKLEDLYSRKRGLAYLGRKVTHSTEIEGEFEVPGPQKDRELSSIEFAWAEDTTITSGPFLRAGHRVLPNPERLFGLYASDLKVFFVARGKQGDDRPWHWRTRVSDSDHNVVAEAESVLTGTGLVGGRCTVDFARQPAGGYDIALQAWQDGDRDTLSRRAHFSVAWTPQSWFRNPKDVEDNVHFLLSADGEEKFARLHPGEQERFLERFWSERDPSPGTAANEARDEFLKRVAHANLNYAANSSTPGIFSDMGRVYVRYGEPNEVLKQVIPTGDNTLLAVIKELMDTEERPLGDVHQKGPGGDIRPYEVWIYEGEIPVPLDVDPKVERNKRHRKLLFLFVDEQGTGDYRLRYSTE